IAKMSQPIKTAKSQNSDLIVFPELTTHGYTSQDWFQDADIIEHALDPLQQIIPATKEITAIVGTSRPNPSKDGRPIVNCAAVLHDGELMGLEDKILLPEYDVFDDPRWF